MPVVWPKPPEGDHRLNAPGRRGGLTSGIVPFWTRGGFGDPAVNTELCDCPVGGRVPRPGPAKRAELVGVVGVWACVLPCDRTSAFACGNLLVVESRCLGRR
eukprot:6573829-Prymnesium_polylepis.2